MLRRRRRGAEEGGGLSGTRVPAIRLRVAALGARARSALARSGGRAEPLAGFEDSPYYLAAGEVVWIGARLPALHPRAAITEASPPRGAARELAPLPEESWSPSLPRPGDASRLAAILEALAAEEAPRGFGALLRGRAPEFPLDLARARAEALIEAYLHDDAVAAFDASIALLGIGPGLTPAGDDFAGGALFARRLAGAHDARWQAMGERLAAEAARRTNRVSAALFSDLARGASFAPLHALADALAAGDDAAALEAARALARIGHSSGWDMLAGVAAGAGAEYHARTWSPSPLTT